MTTTTDNRKAAILEALRAFIRQRPGMDPRNYGDARSYNAERRAVLQDLDDAEHIMGHVFATDAITADDILNADPGGRLTLRFISGVSDLAGKVQVHYTTGQYFAVEFRKAVCRLMASVLWAHASELMPDSVMVNNVRMYPAFSGKGHEHAGDWLRAYFKQQFGRRIASRYFD